MRKLDGYLIQPAGASETALVYSFTLIRNSKAALLCVSVNEKSTWITEVEFLWLSIESQLEILMNRELIIDIGAPSKGT